MADHCCPPPHSFRPWTPSLHPAGMSEEQLSEETTTPLLAATEDSHSHPFFVGLGKFLSAMLPITGIVLGAVYLDQCPRQPLIPIYLIVKGVVVLFLTFLSCFPSAACGEWGRAMIRHLQVTCLLFLSAWFIAGSVWIFAAFPPDYDPRAGRAFCRRGLFLFAFGVTCALHAALAAALLGSLCLLGAALLLGALLPRGGHGDRGGP